MIRFRLFAPLIMIFACACAPTMKVSHADFWALRDKFLDGGAAEQAAFFAAAPGYRFVIEGPAISYALEPCVGETETLLDNGQVLHELFMCRYPHSDADCVTLWINEEQGLVASCTFTEELRHSIKSRSAWHVRWN